MKHGQNEYSQVCFLDYCHQVIDRNEKLDLCCAMSFVRVVGTCCYKSAASAIRTHSKEPVACAQLWWWWLLLLLLSVPLPWLGMSLFLA